MQSVSRSRLVAMMRWKGEKNSEGLDRMSEVSTWRDTRGLSFWSRDVAASARCIHKSLSAYAPHVGQTHAREGRKGKGKEHIHSCLYPLRKREIASRDLLR